MNRLTSLGESVLLLNCTNRTFLSECIALSAFFCGAYEEAEAGFLSICNESKEIEKHIMVSSENGSCERRPCYGQRHASQDRQGRIGGGGEIFKEPFW